MSSPGTSHKQINEHIGLILAMDIVPSLAKRPSCGAHILGLIFQLHQLTTSETSSEGLLANNRNSSDEKGCEKDEEVR